MNKYNPNVHHRRSIRLKGYDYAKAGLYFITICCEKRKHRFGIVKNGQMILNEYGKIAYHEWMKTSEIRKNVELGEFVIMPNHLHGIIRLLGSELHSPKINNNLYSPDKIGVCDKNKMDVCDTSLRSPSQTVGAIVRGYKSSVTKKMGLLNFDGKLWQRNYYEHIIRNENSHKNISEYILNNPTKWTEDKFYTQ